MWRVSKNKYNRRLQSEFKYAVLEILIFENSLFNFFGRKMPIKKDSKCPTSYCHFRWSLKWSLRKSLYYFIYFDVKNSLKWNQHIMLNIWIMISFMNSKWNFSFKLTKWRKLDNLYIWKTKIKSVITVMKQYSQIYFNQ